MDGNAEKRFVDSYCEACGDVVPHLVNNDDLSSCDCTRCGHTEQLMVPLDA